MKMESSAEYQQGYRQRTAEKIFLPFNKDGEVDKDAIEAAKLVEQKFSKFPQFVGVSYRGSTALGYAEKSSDIDLFVIYDGANSQEANETFDRAVDYFHSLPLRMNGREIHLFVAKVSLDELSKDGPTEGIAALCGPARGPRIREFRQKASDWAANLSASEKKNIFQGTIEHISGWEKARLHKIQGRMVDSDVTTREGERAFVVGRQKLWEQRVAKILKLENI